MTTPAHALFLAALALLPWAWFPPFPWIHEHAQWSDVLVAAAFVAWLVTPGRLQALRRWWPVWKAGASYVFEQNRSGNWVERAIPHASDMQADDQFGYQCRPAQS